MSLPIIHRTYCLRIFYLCAVVICIFFGLASRTFDNLLPSFITFHAGDALWAMMVYFGCRLLLVDKKIFSALCCAIIFCYGIELSQLFQAEWVNELRGTLFGALILGHGFLFVDFIRYTIGIFIAAFVDKTAITFLFSYLKSRISE
ncbi:DUF2809 domain-containing protein [Planococcus shenhongbingii]|uniref:DUF2809 domain-containing protein n=1 Tax=Planococcus shenhongbingii TaxID=3058398 RepID=A0ABT8NGK1_9BACL|nr:DUF2809 domain-containing protein [Planococcus sp. N017]MDN7247019.1 DUF2809 domain-containing protein [Planococcus sp. N017]